MFCPGSGTKQAQPGLPLALPAAFADINIHKSRSAILLGVRKVSAEEVTNSNFFLSALVRRLYQVLRKWQP